MIAGTTAGTVNSACGMVVNHFFYNDTVQDVAKDTAKSLVTGMKDLPEF